MAKALAVCAACTTLLALAGYQLYCAKERRDRRRRLAGQTLIRLLPNERAPIVCMSPATSAVTFFEGSVAQARQHLSERVAAIVAANPWLAATLDRHPDTDELSLFVCRAREGPPTTAPPLFSCLEGLGVIRDDRYEQLVKKLQPALCSTSNEAVGRASEPLWKVRLIPLDGQNDRFAVVVSANHSLLDGHGFYKLYSMLSARTPVRSLTVERDQAVPARIRESLGGEPSAMDPAGGFVLRFIFHQILNALSPRTKSMGFYLNESWVNDEKKRAESSGAVPFVSTNDVYTSAFCRAVAADSALMAINFRGRVEGCTEDMAGNYEDLMQYFRQDFATPELIRRSVAPQAGSPFKRAGTPASRPFSSFEHLFGGPTYAAITNWATFNREALALPGATEQLHIPLFDFPSATPARIFGSTVIFRAKDGRIAALVDIFV